MRPVEDTDQETRRRLAEAATALRLFTPDEVAAAAGTDAAEALAWLETDPGIVEHGYRLD
jgi:hypothetical protein